MRVALPFLFCLQLAAGPGMFCAMFRKLLHPLGEGRLHICGKGGETGDAYMLDHAISMLRAQGFTGGRSRILIVGDRFDTDIRAGALAGIRTCLVESGCHSIELQPHFPDAPASFVASSVAELIPPKRRAKAWRKISFDVCSATIGPPTPLRPAARVALSAATARFTNPNKCSEALSKVSVKLASSPRPSCHADPFSGPPCL